MAGSHEDLAQMSDEDLMRLVADTDAAAFEVLYDRHATAAYGLCRRIAGSAAMADDVFQEAFLSVWRSGSRYEPRRGSVRSWILSITHNRAIDQIRRSRKHDDRQVHDDSLAERMPAEDATDAAALGSVAAEETGRALAALPEDQRTVIELAYFSGYTHTEIAEKLEVALGTVKGRMRLGLEKLQAALAEAQ